MVDEFDDLVAGIENFDDDDEFNDLSLALDENILNQLDQIESGMIPQPQRPTASTSRLTSSDIPRHSNLRIPSSGSSVSQSLPSRAHQMNLFGKRAIQAPERNVKTATPSPGLISLSSQSAMADDAQLGSSRFTQAPSKQWDRGAFLARENAKSKDRARSTDFDDDEELPVDLFIGSRRDFDIKQARKYALPPPPETRKLPDIQPRILQLDQEAAQTWIYPTNMDKRDYQYNIVQKALFNNVLVALPTGLGKTFIAAVVILNFFRWYPDGKILFLAPSRPLVDQQKIACHGICGLPWDCAVDLTGSTAKAKRGHLWQSKRIFYMTPQTLENDIRNGSCDAREVVCVVIDEAHKAKGRYAYGNVIGLLMEINPFFRVLALSATPGKDSESVQEVVDNLHINKIEIRTEEAIDVRPYVFKKREEVVNVPLGKDLNIVKDNWSKLMRVKMDPLVKAGLMRDQDPSRLHPFAINSISKNLGFKHILDRQPYLRGNISELSNMARSMQYLMEQSVKMFYNCLNDRASGVNASGKKASTNKQQIYANSNATFRDIMRSLEEMQDWKGRIVHPKMEALKTVLMDHFDQHKIAQMENADAVEESGRNVLGGTPNSQTSTRAMVFCTFRECCTEIVSYFNDSGLKTALFVGQSKDKKGVAGMNQRVQEETIMNFKDGVYDVLVATQIGEEGLDIGSVDLTVCYEAVKDPIRMLQRVGRTGRKREGKIVVLVSEGREQNNWQQSKDNHRAVQKEIESLRSVSLFDDVERMIPDDICPRAELKRVDQPSFDPAMVGDGKAAKPLKSTVKAKQADKPKRDIKRNMPQGALEGFMKASALKVSKRRDGSSSSDSNEGMNILGAERQDETHSQRMQRLLAPSSDDEHDKETLSFNVGSTSSNGTGKRPAQSGSRNPASSASRLGSDAPSKLSSNSLRGKNKLGVQSRRTPSQPSAQNRLSFGSRAMPESTSQLPLSDDDEFGMSNDLIIDRSMETALQVAENELHPQPGEEENSLDNSPLSSPVVTRLHRPHPLIAQIEANEFLFVEDGDADDDDVQLMKTSPNSFVGTPDTVSHDAAFSRRVGTDEVVDASSSSPIKAVPQRRARLIRTAPSATPSPTKEKGTKKLKRNRILIEEDEDEVNDDKHASNLDVITKSIKKAVKASKDKGKLKKRKITNSPTSRALFQWEADRSTDEEVHGERDEADSGIGSSGEDDEDRAAVGDFLPTQAPKGYHQQSIYMQSMLSQAAPAEFQRYNRAPFPGVGGRFGNAPQDRHVTPHRGPWRPGGFLSSASKTNETDRYSQDSFVVDDDEEMVWDSEPDALPPSSI